MKKIKNVIQIIRKRFSDYIQKSFSTKKGTFKLLALCVFTVLFLLEMFMIIVNNSFYNNASDDILQYYTIMVDFISSLKEGTISWFNLNNYFGASFFSDVYYVPFDIFTGTTFLLSYVMPIELAYSVTELIKIFSGVMIFAYYLSLVGMKKRTIFWMGIIYFVGGGSVSFMAFPVFLSLTFYMPLSLVVIYYFFKKKRWIVPLFATGVIFYDFYLGYTILAFISFAYIIEYLKRPRFRFIVFLKESLIFFTLIMLGVIMSAVIAFPSIIYILEETYRNTADFNAWIVHIGSFELKLFQPNIYIRMIAKMFVEQKPIGFYGFENSYATEHFSLYITVYGLMYMNYIFFMKDKISKIYKIVIIIGLLMMFFPLFSYVFSGTLDAPYTRWINMLPIFQIMILAHVFDKYGFEKIKMKYMTILISIGLLLLGGLIYYYINHINTDDYLASRDVLTADTYLFGSAAIFLIILLIFGWLKKWTVIKVFLWIEILVAIGYIYSGPVSIGNKIDTFENAHQIDRFLSSNLDDEEFYRVYVDIDNLDVEDTNFNRMTRFPTNTGIFHSWTDAETNMISKLLYNVTETQSKNKMNTFGYYINHFLGYKYVLVNANSNYNFSKENFNLISKNENYKLYQMNFSTSFRVYENYMTYDEFNLRTKQYSTLAKEKIFLLSALIEDEDKLNSIANLEKFEGTVDSNSDYLYIYKKVNTATKVNTTGVTGDEIKTYYRYSNETLDIDYNAGAIYFKAPYLKVEDYKSVFMQFSDGTKKGCLIQPDNAHQVKCEFSNQPDAIYIEDTEQMTIAPSLRVRYEAAIDRSAYLVYDLSSLLQNTDIDIIKFNFTTSTIDIKKAYVLDEQGNKSYLIDGFYMTGNRPVKLYIYKTSDIYDYSNIFGLNIRYSYDNLDDIERILSNDFITDDQLSIKNGKIHLSYTNLSNSDKDQIVVIPICYSDDWHFKSDIKYDTISTSGGFLGIIIPSGTETVDITLKFIPKDLNYGFLISMTGIIVYLGIFIPYWKKLKNKKNGDNLDETRKINSSIM